MDKLRSSEEFVAKIVEFLAKRGVSKIDFSVVDLGYERSNDLDVHFVYALKWLKDEGIVRSNAYHEFVGGTEHEQVAQDFVLTSLGFALLAKPFDGDLTLGAVIKRTNEAGRSFSTTGDFFGGILGGFTKSLAS